MNNHTEKAVEASTGKQQEDHLPQTPQPAVDKKENEINDQGPVSKQDYSSTKNQSGKNTDPDSED